MTAPSGFVPDEQHRASRELLKQVGMPAGPVSEYFPVRNEGQPGVEDVIRSGCARSDSQPAWMVEAQDVGQLDPQSPSDLLACVASFLQYLRLGFGVAVGECGEATRGRTQTPTRSSAHTGSAPGPAPERRPAPAGSPPGSSDGGWSHTWRGPPAARPPAAPGPARPAPPPAGRGEHERHPRTCRCHQPRLERTLHAVAARS